MNGTRRALPFVIGILVAAILVVGGSLAGSVTAADFARPVIVTPPIEGFDLFWEAWRIVERDYVGELPNDEEVARGAARGLVRSLNNYATSLIAPEFAQLEREESSGFYKGIGASVRSVDGLVAIAVIFPGSPAEESGLEVGDIILAVDGKDVQGVSLYEVVSLIRGPAGTRVALRIMRPATGESLEKQVERREIEIPTATVEVLPQGIAHIRLSDFNGQATSQLQTALRMAEREKVWGIILDLRDNPGGFLDQAISVADEFLDYGPVVIERGRLEPERIHYSQDGGLATDLRLVVLVNGGSASASEIVAGAVQARKRGVLVGERSFGKGSVQFSFDLSDGSQLRVTTALWYTPDNRLIQDSGLQPDIEVAPDDSGQTDPQLQAAIQYLLERQP
ncbi:MAG: S41 family peptidase [Anaerolineae bacterium]